MPVRKKKGTTSPPSASMPESSELCMPDQKAFHQYLHLLAQSAVRTVIEAVMIEELDAFIGADWGEQSLKRQGHRNSFYRRDLVTIKWRVCVEIGF
jgi:transposase-like protein